MTGPEFQTILLRHAISVREFAAVSGRDQSTIKRWLKNGVPEMHVSSIASFVAEIEKHGVQLDAFPETYDDRT